MATQVPRMGGQKPSFASVVAMTPPLHHGPGSSGRENEVPPKSTRPSAPSTKKPANPGTTLPEGELRESMSRLNVSGPPASKTLNEQAKTNIKRAGLRLDDDQTNLSSSSNKPPSLDGKSTTSGTTFALDEKESLRPDDSASAKAIEDEDSLSGLTSGAPNSRVGSEAGSRALRDQYFDGGENLATISHRPHPLSRKVIEGIAEEEPQTLQPTLPPDMHSPPDLPRSDVVPPLQPPLDMLYREPDEKLFEALESPKDRIFLLRLEEEIISFIKSSSDPKIDLPPCNSFCRLLAHKLADYYCLTHYVDNAVSSVTLYRTPYCRLPKPLSELAKARVVSAPVVTPTAAPTMKIMRRPGAAKDSPNLDSGAGTTESSAFPSKAGSEVGEDNQHGPGVASPTGSAAARDKPSLTREEREARYREKREEIFGPQTEDGDSAESNKEISRTSSRNEKKRKKPKRDDDGFEARSQFNAYYPGMPYSISPYESSMNGNAVFASFGIQTGTIPHQPGMLGMAIPPQYYQQGIQSLPTGQGYPPLLVHGTTMNGYIAQPIGFQGPSPPTMPQQPSGPFYAPVHHGASKGHQSPAMSSPAMNASAQISRQHPQTPDPQWLQNGYSNSYQPNMQQHQYYQQMTSPMPYPYGQLPFQPGQHSGKPAHPLPGSYNRTTFNPQTRAFVPSGNSVQQQPMTTANPASYTGNPATSMTMHTSKPLPNGNPLNSYPQIPAYPPIHYTPSHTDQMSSKQYNSVNSNRKPSSQTSPTPASPNESAAPQQSTLSKWGTPANLPPKPPPPEASNVSESQHSLPMNNQFGVNVRAMNSGQPMPNFQNGVYTMPGVGGP